VGDRDSGARLEEAEVGPIFRAEFGRSVAALIRIFGDVDLADDAVQESFAVALEVWPRDGLPANPGGWITTTARNRAIDRLRRDSRGRELLKEVAMTSSGDDPGPAFEQAQGGSDELTIARGQASVKGRVRSASRQNHRGRLISLRP
jgi:RNA polymerase sigma-70 factor, ECF subfamily